MIECELCGKNRAETKAEVEGAILNVCRECASFGKEIPKIKIKTAKTTLPRLEHDEDVVEDLKEIVKKERYNLKLTQKELAKEIGEKTSVIKRIEGGWIPPTKTIKKLERVFGIKLREEVVEEKVEKSKKQELTIGDIVEVN